MESVLETIREEAGYRDPRTMSDEKRTAFYRSVRAFLVQACIVVACVAVLYAFIVAFAIVLQDYTGEWNGYNY